MATLQEIRIHFVNKARARAAAWSAEYPFAIELQEKHYAWDYEQDAEDRLPEMEDWLVEHAGEGFSFHSRSIGFTDRNMAFAFKIRWA